MTLTLAKGKHAFLYKEEKENKSYGMNKTAAVRTTTPKTLMNNDDDEENNNNMLKRSKCKHCNLNYFLQFLCAYVFFFMQGKFSLVPSVFVTAVHYHAGLKGDAASVWIEDVKQSSFQVCLRELQNYAGLHRDVYVVSVAFFIYLNLPEVM